MTSTTTDMSSEAFTARIMALATLPVDGYPHVKSELHSIAYEVEAAPLGTNDRATVAYVLTAVMINAAEDAGDEDGLETGVGWARDLANDPSTPLTLALQAQLNQASGLAVLLALAEEMNPDVAAANHSWEATIGFRLTHLGQSRPIRTLLESAANNQVLHPVPRSLALCNLANRLDDDGRWVEAYAAYSDALAADPTNGNAAGNIAELLRRRLSQRGGQHGHLAAVYNHYVRTAHQLRQRTVEIAGEGAAQLFDRLRPMAGEGHYSHDGDALNEYQQWIVRHRLALAATVEGLGSDSEKWDSATVTSVTGSVSDPAVPPIFAAFNVLKAEFLVARKLAFRGITMIDESAPLQHPEDTGLYSSTGDGGYYGEGPALLLLAQRSALDVLDKIAVAANEHFTTGLRPSRVNFGEFWFEPKTGHARPVLAANDPGKIHILALAQLADDYHNGMYAQAKLLRNAGTHRLVHTTFGVPTGPTDDTFSSVDVEDLKDATVAALWVARAAYLYFVDLLDSQASSHSVPPRVVPNPI